MYRPSGSPQLQQPVLQCYVSSIQKFEFQVFLLLLSVNSSVLFYLRYFCFRQLQKVLSLKSFKCSAGRGHWNWEGAADRPPVGASSCQVCKERGWSLLQSPMTQSLIPPVSARPPYHRLSSWLFCRSWAQQDGKQGIRTCGILHSPRQMHIKGKTDPPKNGTCGCCERETQHRDPGCFPFSSLPQSHTTQFLLTLLWSTECHPPSAGAQADEQLPRRLVCLLFKRLPWFLVDSCFSLDDRVLLHFHGQALCGLLSQALVSRLGPGMGWDITLLRGDLCRWDTASDAQMWHLCVGPVLFTYLLFLLDSMWLLLPTFGHESLFHLAFMGIQVACSIFSL